MNDDDLLFGVDELDRWKRGELPDDWMKQQADILIARCRTLSDDLEKLHQTLSPEEWNRLNAPM